MKSTLTAFAALAALALPAGLPTLAMAQDQITDPAPALDEPSSAPPEARVYQALQTSRQAPVEVQQVQDRRGGDRGGNRGNRGGGGGGGGGESARGDRGGGGGWNRGDNPGRDQGGRGDRGNEGRGDRGRGGGDSAPRDDRWNRPNPPATPEVTPPSQDRGGQDRVRDRDRGGRGGDRGQNNGGLNGGDRDRGDRGRDRNGQDGNRGNDGRDRNNGGWNNGQNWGQNNGGWDRDRNNGGRNWNSDRQGRRDYGGFRNRWNQNDWRRDWNRGRSNDWWRNDRGFRGYTGFRSGFYFAPNYGYYAVPRQYFGQRYYEGQYLPSIFWRYSLNDYRTYGLGYPPPGTQWVAVDNTIYLIDSIDGYIIEVIYDAWRW